MNLYIDTADSAIISRFIARGIIDGITTNPTNLAKMGSNPHMHIEILSKMLPESAISVEITESHPEKVYIQAHNIQNLASNILVKIPCHREYYPIIHRLVL